MKQVIGKAALRIKVTGLCNRTCNFCNEEGDMRTIEPVIPDKAFFECIRAIACTLGIDRAMLTGGEPTIHPCLHEIVQGIKLSDISITTNGVHAFSVEKWRALRDLGLRKLIVSIHDATPQAFIRLETRQRGFAWAMRALESQKHNLVTASQAGLQVRVNTVAYHSREQVHQVLNALGILQQQYGFEIRMLNDLTNVEKSQQIIRGVCQELGATAIGEERRAGSSNVTVRLATETGSRFSTKTAYRYFFDSICTGCTLKDQCHEGFYGVRIEKRASDYWVRLCLYKDTPDVLMPWKSFLRSGLAEQLKGLHEQERLV